MGELYEIVPLSSVVKINSGIALPKIFKNKKSTNGKYQFYKVAQMNNDSNIMKDADLRFTEEEAKKFKIKIFPKGSVLIPKRGGAILTNKKRLLVENSSYDSNIMGLKADNSVLSDEFLVVYMKSINLADYIDTSTIPQINNKHITQMKIPLPPLQEQKRIVAKLDSLFAKIDQALALHQQNIDEAEGFMGSVLNEVFGELEGKGIVSTKRMNECFIVKDGTHDSPKYIKDNGYPLFTSKNLKEYGIDRSNFKLIKEEDYSKINQRSKVDKGDLLFAMIGTIGNPTLVDFEPDFAIKNVALFKSLDNKSSMEYLRYYLMSNFVISKMRDEANGATQKFVGLTYLRNFPFPYISIKTQQKTITYLDQLSQKTEKLKQVQTQKLESLKALKASLLDRAFRGEI